jgi:aspartyl-tRNA(Asn)/glutamyl-tRNA(Gln) amidotransferase subunit C
MISKEEVKHIANLARIKLTEEEEDKFTKELSFILDFVDRLNEVDTKDVKPIDQITGLQNVMREDKDPETVSKEDKERLIGQAPSKKDDLIKVKAVLK